MSAIFISHSSKDNASAGELKRRLEAQGHRSIFLDFDPEDGIPPGRNWEQELYQRVRASRAVIVLCSRHSMASRWCFMEITHARALGKDLFPVRLDDCEVDGVLTDRQVVDLTADPESAYERLFRGILASGLDPADAFDWDGHRPPYPGLLAFQEEDAAIFFGRDAEIGEGLDLVNKVRRLGETGLVMVLGASGSGKSSLVRAGLLPRLRRDVERWLVVDPFRPRANPVAELAAALSRAFEALGRSQPPELLEERLAQAIEPPEEMPVATAPAEGAKEGEPESDRERFLAAMRQLESALPARAGRRAARYLRLLRASVESAGSASAAAAGSRGARPGGEDVLGEIAVDLRRASHREEARVLLVIDQFEELLGRGASDPGHRFLRLVRRTIETRDSPCLVLGTMRSDFLDRFQSSPALLDIRYESLSLGPLSPGNVAQIIEKPAELAAIDLESGLVQTLVADAKTEDALPLLAFTLRELNERYGGDGVLTLAEYSDRLGGLNGAVARAAGDVLAAAAPKPEQEEQLRRAFLSLVRITEDGTFARRIARWDEMPAAIHPLLESFVNARLLVAGSDESGRTLEVAHEAIYRSWDRLARWLEEGTEALQLARDIQVGARIWEDDGRSLDDLWRGARLARARELIASGDLRLADSSREFVEASYRAERAAVEAEEARRRRVFRAVLGGAIGATILAAIAGLFWFRAEAEARKARDHGRVAVAGEWLAKDPTKAALVLLELERPAETPLAVAAMRAALARTRLQAELRGHREAVTSAVFSPDGSRVLTASWDGTARVWSLEGGAEPVVLAGHEDDVTEAAFSPDGARVVTASVDGTARVWPAAGGEPAILAPHGGRVTSAVFAPGGGRVATGSVDGVARVWPLDGAAEPILLEGHRDAVWRVAFSPDGTRLATASGDGTARLWPLDGGRPLEFAGHEGAVVDVAFDAGGENVVTASLDGTARLWLGDGRATVALLGHEDAVWSARFTVDGSRVVTASDDGTVRVWSLDGVVETVFEEHQGRVKSARVSGDGGRVASVSTDGTARVWRLDRGGDTILLQGHQGPVNDAAFSPDGSRLVTASEDATARLWAVDEIGDPVILATGRGTVAAFSPDGLSVATGAADGSVLLWAAEGEPLQALGSHESAVSEVAFDPAGERLASASADGTARIWRLDDPAPPLALEGHEAGLTDVRFSPDGALVATASRDGTARLWPVSGGEPVVLAGHEAGVSAAVFSPTGDRLVTASADRTARVWRVDGAGPAEILTGHEGPVTSVLFSPDGSLVVTGSGDETARLWPVSGGEPVVLAGHTGTVAAVAFSPDGSRVATASADGTARVWRSDGTLEVVHLGHEDFVVSVQFSADGASLATGALDGTVRIWPATETGEAVVLRGHHGRVSSAEFSPDGTRILSAGSEAGTARVWAIGIDRLQRLIRQSTTLCLDPDFRKRSLGEAVETARSRFEACERSRGR